MVSKCLTMNFTVSNNATVLNYTSNQPQTSVDKQHDCKTSDKFKLYVSLGSVRPTVFRHKKTLGRG